MHDSQWVVGDRPYQKRERVHYKLWHRCKHVVASDRAKSKGTLANVNLTHSGMVDDPALDKTYSYETYIAHLCTC